MNTSNGTYADNKLTWFFDFIPREVIYNNKKVYVYNQLKATTRSITSIRANPSEAYKNASFSNNTFDFIERNLPTVSNTAVNQVFDNNSITTVNSRLLGRVKSDGTMQYQYNDARGGYPFFARTPYQNPGDKVYSQYRDDAGSVSYASAPIVGVFDVEICKPAGTDLCTIGACCPGGTKWDCDTNSCVLDEFMCPA